MNINLSGMFVHAERLSRDEVAVAARRIINNGSISAHTPRPNSVAYTATKHAVMGMTKTALDGRRVRYCRGSDRCRQRGDRAAPAHDAGVQRANGRLRTRVPLMDVVASSAKR